MTDLRVAARELRAAPVLTAVAILSLALGIGANTAVFSLVNSLLLQPLPVVEPERLALVSDTRAASQGFTAAWTYPTWDQIHQRAQPFDGACANSSSIAAHPCHSRENNRRNAALIASSSKARLRFSPMSTRGR